MRVWVSSSLHAFSNAVASAARRLYSSMLIASEASSRAIIASAFFMFSS